MSKEEIYDAEINPLMGQIIAICKRAGIACFCTFDISPEVEPEDGPLMCTTCLPDETGKFPDAIDRASAAVNRRGSFMAFTITSKADR